VPDDTTNPAAGSADESSIPDVDRLPASGSGEFPMEERSSTVNATDKAIDGHSLDARKTVISQRRPASRPAFSRAISPFEMGEQLVGQRLGHFQLQEFVGGGGMGAVFRADDTMLGRTVAVKVVSREQTNEDTLRRFKNEAQSAARLDHPNIARVYYVGEDQGWHYIVFEYIEGVNVRDLVDHKGPLSLNEAISYTLQVAEALEHASQRDVIHRDIKPSNILIMIDGHAKLVDMGLARLHQVETSSEDLTASGVTLGTFDYISPEQARDPRDTDVRSDIYSLGCTLYFMLTGQPPFPDGTVLQKLLNHSGVEPPDPREYRADLPPDVVEVLFRMLAKIPEQRYQTPRELIAALILLADRLDLSGVRHQSAVRVTPAEAPRSLAAQTLPWFVPIVLLAITALVVRWQTQPPTDFEFPAPRLVEASVAPEFRPGDSSDSNSVNESKKSSSSISPARESSEITSDRDGITDGSSVRDSDQGSKVASRPGNEDERQEEKLGGSGRTGSEGTPEHPAMSVTHTADPSREANSSATVRSDLPTQSGEVTAPGVARVGSSTVIIVSDDDIVSDSDALVFPTLAGALQAVTQLDRVAEIELRFSGVRRVPAQDLPIDQIPRQNLVIRGAEGYRPVIQFDDASEDSVSEGPNAMMRVLGGHLTWLDTHFYWDASSVDDEPRQRCLFLLDSIDKVEFRRCTFTIRGQTSSEDTSLAFFRLNSRSNVPSVDSTDQTMSSSVPTIWLEQCLARGQASFIVADRAVPFLLSWDHGVFLSSRRLVEVGGTDVPPRWEHGRVTLFLRRMLAVNELGLCLMKADPSAPFHLGLAANCYDCLMVTGRTMPAYGLYQLSGGVSTEDSGMFVDVSGSNNYYKNTKTVLEISTSDPDSPNHKFTFDDLNTDEGASWFHEERPQPGTMFSWEESLLPFDQRTLSDYLSAGIGDGPFTRILRINADQLPRFPAGLTSSLLPDPDVAPMSERNDELEGEDTNAQ